MARFDVEKQGQATTQGTNMRKKQRNKQVLTANDNLEETLRGWWRAIWWNKRARQKRRGPTTSKQQRELTSELPNDHQNRRNDTTRTPLADKKATETSRKKAFKKQRKIETDADPNLCQYISSDWSNITKTIIFTGLPQEKRTGSQHVNKDARDAEELILVKAKQNVTAC